MRSTPCPIATLALGNRPPRVGAALRVLRKSAASGGAQKHATGFGLSPQK